jgi:hypothetical protein
MQFVGSGFENASLEYLKNLHYNREWLLLELANYVFTLKKHKKHNYAKQNILKAP